MADSTVRCRARSITYWCGDEFAQVIELREQIIKQLSGERRITRPVISGHIQQL